MCDCICQKEPSKCTTAWCIHSNGLCVIFSKLNWSTLTSLSALVVFKWLWEDISNCIIFILHMKDTCPHWAVWTIHLWEHQLVRRQYNYIIMIFMQSAKISSYIYNQHVNVKNKHLQCLQCFLYFSDVVISKCRGEFHHDNIFNLMPPYRITGHSSVTRRHTYNNHWGGGV